MIDYAKGTAGINNRPIREWTVLFHIVQFGLVGTLQEALNICKEKELDPQMNIFPVTAAVMEDNEYEVIIR